MWRSENYHDVFISPPCESVNISPFFRSCIVCYISQFIFVYEISGEDIMQQKIYEQF